MRLKNFMDQEYIIEMSIGKAASFADKYHSGQHRKSSGEPYIKHPLNTYRILKQIGVKNKDILISAFLHDTIEDTPVTYNNIKKEFNKTIADIVKGVTSDNKQIKIQGKPFYLADKMISMSDNTLIVKLADRLQNLADINTSSPSFAEKMYNQTRFIIDRLRYKRTLKPIHKKLLRLIDKQLNTYNPS